MSAPITDIKFQMPATYVAQPNVETFESMPIIVGKSTGTNRIPLPHGVYHAPSNFGSYWAFTIPACPDPRTPVMRVFTMWGNPTGGGFHLSTTAPGAQVLKDAHTVQVTVTNMPAGA